MGWSRSGCCSEGSRLGVDHGPQVPTWVRVSLQDAGPSSVTAILAGTVPSSPQGVSRVASDQPGWL